MKVNRMYRFIVVFLPLLGVLLNPWPAIAQRTLVQEKPKTYVEVILDASGSMYGKVDGRLKIDIAREVIESIISEVFVTERDDLEFALRVYGHRSPKKNRDCHDSTLEYPLGRVDMEYLKKILSQIKPLGYTPIAYSLEQAAQDLPQEGTPQEGKPRRVVILVTDGIESCKDSPCQAAKELMEAGAFTSIHVIGFGMTQESMSLLECITQASGGMLLDAQNTLELKETFKQAVSEAVDAGFRVQVNVNEKPSSEATVMLYPSGSSTPIRMRPVDPEGQQIIYAPPGIYDLAVREHTTEIVQWVRNISGEVGEVVEQSFNFFSGGLRANVTVNEEPTVEADIYVYRSGENQFIRKRQVGINGENIICLPVGTFDIRVVERTTETGQWLRGVQVGQGELLEHQFNFMRAGFQVQAKINGELTAEARFELYPHGEDKPRRIVQAQVEQPQIIYIPPGTYDIKTLAFNVQGVKWAREITLEAGDVHPLEFDFPLSGLLLGVTLDGEYTGNARIEAYPAGESQPLKKTRASFKGELQLILPAGEYDLRVVDFATRQEKWHRGISLAEGQILKQHFEFTRPRM
jgi:hypothetical protein